MLPMSLQKLLQETEYPPQRPMLMQTSTNKVVMIVDTVSPTPFALLRRANHFQYRDDDRALREYSEYEDPVQALTEECKRVLKAISAANQSQASSSKHSTSLRDASWSRFADNGFSSTLDEEDEDDDSSHLVQRRTPGLRSTPASGLGLARPTTPSWADFLSSGFVDDNHHNQTGMLLPPDKFLPPIETTVRQKSSQSHQPRLESEKRLEPGELASITRFDLDDAFWWVWMSSLSPEETPERKSAFGRCAVIETVIRSGRWLVVEEMVKGAAPEPDPGAYIAEKKSFFSWTRRGKSLGRRKSTGKNALDKNDVTLKTNSTMASKTSIGPDQHARIQAAAQQLQAKQARERKQSAPVMEPRRREDDRSSGKTDSVLTTNILNEASSALKWASQYDKDALREVYLSDAKAGRGVSQTNGNGYHPGPSASMQELRSPVGPSMSARELRSPALIGPSKSQAFSPTQPSPGPSATSPALASPVPPRKEPYGASEKAVEAPKEPHPAERPAASTSRQSPVPPPPPKEAAKQPTSMEIMRNEAVSPEPGTSPGGPKPPQKKLHKEVPVRPAPVQQEKEKDKDKAAPGPGGFRKLFGRPKIRQSKVPENAAAEVNGMLARDSAAPTPEPARPVSAADPPMVVSSPETEPEKETAPVTSPTAPLPSPQKPQQPQPEPTAAPQQRSGPPRQPEPTYEPSLDSRVDTDDAREAQDEFSRFDQGPLVDQPAFVPEDTDSDDATPPPIARRKEPVPVVAPAVHKAPAVPQQPQPQPQPQPQQQQTISVRERVAAAQATSIPVRERPTVPSATAPAAAPVKRQAAPTTETEKPAVLAPQDRWAQIRKNAAERAAQRQADDPMPRGAGYRKPSGDHDDDTSGEESKS